MPIFIDRRVFHRGHPRLPPWTDRVENSNRLRKLLPLPWPRWPHLGIPTNAWPGLQCLVRISTILTATPTHLTFTPLDMSGTAGHTTRVSRPVCRQPMGSSDEKRTRRYARDFSQINITYTGDISSSGRSTQRGPDVEKDLPRIPSTSTGLWDADPVTVSSEMMASPVTSPEPSLPPLPGSKNLRRTPTTEAQKIAARYRRRGGSSEVPQSEVSCPPKLEVSPFLVLVILVLSHTYRG